MSLIIIDGISNYNCQFTGSVKNLPYQNKGAGLLTIPVNCEREYKQDAAFLKFCLKKPYL